MVSDIFLLERTATTPVKWIKGARSFFSASNSEKPHVPDNQLKLSGDAFKAFNTLIFKRRLNQILKFSVAPFF